MVNALSDKLSAKVNRSGYTHEISFKNGEAESALKITGKIKKRITGTEISTFGLIF